MSGWLPAATTGRAPLRQPFRGIFEALPFDEVAFELVGTTERDAIAVLGGISAGRHLTAHVHDESEGWWQAQCGFGRALDPADYALLGIDFLGSQLASGDAVPRVDTRDQAQALCAVLDHLGIERLQAIVGSSYGGMVALAFGALYPERVERLIVIGAAHQPHPMASGIRAVQRDIVRLASAHGHPAAGLDLARRLAMTTYRTAEEFAERFLTSEQVESYLAYCGRRYVERFTAERFLCLSHSIDLHCINPRDIAVPCKLVAIEGDAIAPPWQIRGLARELRQATLIEISSMYGHDAFLKESVAIADILRQPAVVEVNS